ncbi:cytochrome c [Phenylobacterium sp. J367]|uniref:c-type cytochrome n=1 Tax=Phenylobacterium sp. J367 TaxID=2898435 RepID=UPI0021515E90|nr:cytochrome c [Phenylobacterium sp. J367]MCR5879839.1 cytochrome c [Phenylobacterium sp. J367]
MGVLLALVAYPAAALSDAAQEVERGRALAERNCGMCHATGRTDASKYRGAPAFRDLHLRYDVEALGEALAEGILTGHPAMPEFRFAPDEVISMIHYLRSIQSRQETSLPKPPIRVR